MPVFPDSYHNLHKNPKQTLPQLKLSAKEKEPIPQSQKEIHFFFQAYIAAYLSTYNLSVKFFIQNTKKSPERTEDNKCNMDPIAVSIATLQNDRLQGDTQATYFFAFFCTNRIFTISSMCLCV